MMIRSFDAMVSAACENSLARLMFGKILEDSGVLRPSYCRDACETAYAEGQRAVGLVLFKMLHGLDEGLPLRCMREYGQWLAETYKEESNNG